MKRLIGATTLGLGLALLALLLFHASIAAEPPQPVQRQTDSVPAAEGQQIALPPLDHIQPPPPVAGPVIAPNMKIASNLGLLVALQAQAGRGEEISVSPDRPLGQELARIQAEGLVEVSARFAHELSEEERAQVEVLGVEFQRVAGQLAHLDRFYGLLVPVEAVDDLAALPFTEWLEATWQPVAPAPLDVSIPASNVPAVWQVSTGGGPFGVFGTPLTGMGVTIADFDTGVDVHHPDFLQGSYQVPLPSGSCDWDANGNGTFDSGTDKFTFIPGFLRYWNPLGDPNNTGSLEPTQDWIYLDADNSGTYTTSETIYMAYDVDGDGILETAPVSECLHSLGNFTPGSGIPTSKISATLNAGGVQRTRGVDLELTTADTNGHGTGVSGILVGGNAILCFTGSCSQVYSNTRRYTGVAPNADLLVADRIGNAFSTYIPWAAGLGAKVMLYEYGGWVWQYLDGSSNHEQLMDTASLTSGAVQVVPTSNLHGGGRHLQYSVASGTSVYTFNVPVLGGTGISMTYVSMVWLTPTNNMTVALTAPAGPSGVLPCTLAGGGWLSTTIGGHTVWCERAPNSSRGTALYNIFITRGGGVATGNWRMSVSNPSGSAQLTNFYIADDATSWSGGAAWINTGSGVEKHTATWPSTCDTCIGVASYATRAYATGTAGNISFFSGRGPRFFDGAQVVDVTAPGHYDVISTESKDASWGGPVGALGKYSCRSPASTWGCFGGTSAAGPHVAGVAALLMQFAANNGDPADIETAIQRSAVSDAFTGATPNDTWGYGKLDAYGALLNMMHDLGDAPDSTNHYGVSMSAYPRAFPGVQANFPTVYAGATPPGPLHRQAGSLASGPLDSCLGWRVSAEGDADKWFDEDAMQNISPTIDAPNGDDAGFSPWTTDDALAYGVGVLTHCVPSTFTYYVTLVTGTVSTHYVNVWLDWNRDGDWGDVFTCTAPVAGPASEWAVQNDMVTYTAAGLYTMTTSVFLPYQPGDPYDPIWMRMTLSEQPPPVDPATGRADGRGPAGGYAYGETEDRLIAYTALAGFQVATTTTCMSYTVAFTNTTTGSRPITYTWDFGDGTIVVTTTRTHPTHHYALPGNFAVVLTATNDPLGYMPYFTIYSSALTVQPSPKAGFTSNTPVRLGGTMVFTNVTTGAIAYNWDFGDGIGTSTAMNPTYVYNSGGVYTVTLTAANTQGCMNAYADRVTVTSPIYLPLVLRNYP